MLTLAAVHHLLKKEWHLPIHLAKIQQQTLKALGISTTEVNWILHRVEWRYQVDIAEEVPLQITLEEFMQFLVGQRNTIRTLSCGQ